MDLNIASLKINIHTNIGELNEKRLKVLREIISSNDFNTEQPGPSNILLFSNPEKRQALLVTDSQIHFSFDQCNIDLIEDCIKIVIQYSEKIINELLLGDKFNLNLEIIAETPNFTSGKKAALEKSIEKFTSASRKTLKENLMEIEIVGLRFANKIDGKSYDSRIEPLARDNNQFFISQTVLYQEQQVLESIEDNVIEGIDYFKGEFFTFLKDNFLI